MRKLILIDGNAIIHRAFHALPPFETSKGILVNAVYGFASTLLNLLNFEKPDFIIVSFDLPGKTFRHEAYKEYKATRKKAPQELYDQIPYIKELVKAFEIPIFELEGFEADDVLGTLAAQAEEHEDLKTYIFTGDKDAFQLVTKKVNVLMPVNGFKEPILYDTQKVLEKLGLKPSQVPDMKGLEGDNSDNIKGIRGIGPKTARTLLQKYEDLDGIYENLDEITGNTHDKLEQGKEDAFFSKKLATILKDIPITLNLDKCKSHNYDKEHLIKHFEILEFKTLINRLNKFNSHSEKVRKISADSQQSLF